MPLSIDTETTGLFFSLGCEAFSIGVYNGEDFTHFTLPVNPLTRRKNQRFDSDSIRRYLDTEDVWMFQNANFDLKALCMEGIVDWEEPDYAEFWEGIIELKHLTHIKDSTDSGRKSSLKAVAPKYLGVNYRSEEELDRVVARCRSFVRSRKPDWKIASLKNCPYSKTNDKWVKQDMWLPAAVAQNFPAEEVRKYFNNDDHQDYELLATICREYLKDDCVYTYDLSAGLIQTLTEEEEEALKMNRQLGHVVWKMETKGVPVDLNVINNCINQCNDSIKKYMNTCITLSNQEPKGSKGDYTDAQLRSYLFDGLGITPLETTQSGLNSVAAKTLLKIKKLEETPKEAKEFLAHLIAARKLIKKNQYANSYRSKAVNHKNVHTNWRKITNRKSSYLFPSLDATGTGTTRFTSNDPNGQQTEKGNNPFEDEDDDIAALLDDAPKLRTCFQVEKGTWWFPIDYSQLQLRVFAALSQEEDLIQSFRDGHDYHDYMARRINELLDPSWEGTPNSGERRRAKAVNFGFIFGSGPKKIDSTSGVQGLYSSLLEMFPNAKEFISETKDEIADEGKVYCVNGYPLAIPLTPNPWDGNLSYAAHKGVNYKVQGTEGVIIKDALVMLDDYLTSLDNSKYRLVFTIHDEIIIRTPVNPDPKIIKKCCQLMYDAGMIYGIETPVDAEYTSSNLQVKHDYQITL